MDQEINVKEESQKIAQEVLEQSLEDSTEAVVKTFKELKEAARIFISRLQKISKAQLLTQINKYEFTHGELKTSTEQLKKAITIDLDIAKSIQEQVDIFDKAINSFLGYTLGFIYVYSSKQNKNKINNQVEILAQQEMRSFISQTMSNERKVSMDEDQQTLLKQINFEKKYDTIQQTINERAKHYNYIYATAWARSRDLSYYQNHPDTFSSQNIKGVMVFRIRPKYRKHLKISKKYTNSANYSFYWWKEYNTKGYAALEGISKSVANQGYLREGYVHALLENAFRVNEGKLVNLEKDLEILSQYFDQTDNKAEALGQDIFDKANNIHFIVKSDSFDLQAVGPYVQQAFVILSKDDNTTRSDFEKWRKKQTNLSLRQETIRKLNEGAESILSKELQQLLEEEDKKLLKATTYKEIDFKGRFL